MAFSIRCSRCNTICSSAEKCDRVSCALPPYYTAYQSFFRRHAPTKHYFALTGGRNSGKTYYLMSLIDTLLNPDNYTKAFFERNGIAEFMMIDPISNDLYDELIDQYKSRELNFTNESVALGFFNLILRTKNDNFIEVVLFNTSGEKIEREVEKRKYVTIEHEMKGSVTLHFLDPREDSKLNFILDNKKEGYPCSNLNITQHLYKVLQHESGHIRKLKNPIAICISKFDLLASRIPHDIPANPYIEPHNAQFFRSIEEKSQDLSLFLSNYSQTVIPEDLNQKFSSLNYFAVAPYGSDIKPANYLHREPKGIVAPFFWSLKELKIITEYL